MKTYKHEIDARIHSVRYHAVSETLLLKVINYMKELDKKSEIKSWVNYELEPDGIFVFSYLPALW